MQAAHGDYRPARRTGRERRVVLVALAEQREVVGHVRGGDLGDLSGTARGQRRGVPLQVPAVRLDRVSGQPALDGEMVEVPADRRGYLRQLTALSSDAQAGAQARTSATGV
jgi:hypothetical protein